MHLSGESLFGLFSGLFGGEERGDLGFDVGQGLRGRVLAGAGEFLTVEELIDIFTGTNKTAR